MPKVYSKQDNVISVPVGEEFIIELESSPTTGYQWQLTSDSKIRVLGDDFQLSSNAIGAAGRQKFTLRAVKSGAATISVEYKRPWESSAIQKKEFRVKIKE